LYIQSAAASGLAGKLPRRSFPQGSWWDPSGCIGSTSWCPRRQTTICCRWPSCCAALRHRHSSNGSLRPRCRWLTSAEDLASARWRGHGFTL